MRTISFHSSKIIKKKSLLVGRRSISSTKFTRIYFLNFPKSVTIESTNSQYYQCEVTNTARPLFFLFIAASLHSPSKSYTVALHNPLAERNRKGIRFSRFAAYLRDQRSIQPDSFEIRDYRTVAIIQNPFISRCNRGNNRRSRNGFPSRGCWVGNGNTF